MTRLIVEVPSEKIRLFRRILLRMGIASHTVHDRSSRKPLIRRRMITQTLHKISSSFILFDWEFFSNELEYE